MANSLNSKINASRIEELETIELVSVEDHAPEIGIKKLWKRHWLRRLRFTFITVPIAGVKA